MSLYVFIIVSYELQKNASVVYIHMKCITY